MFVGEVSGAGRLRSGELFTGTPTVTELTTSDLTIDNVAVSTSELTIDGVAVPAGQAITFRASGHVAGTTYRILEVTALYSGDDVAAYRLEVAK